MESYSSILFKRGIAKCFPNLIISYHPKKSLQDDELQIIYDLCYCYTYYAERIYLNAEELLIFENNLSKNGTLKLIREFTKLDDIRILIVSILNHFGIYVEYALTLF